MDVNLLRKFYEGKCSSEEAAEVLQWFKEGEKEETLRQLSAYWEELPDATQHINHNASSILQNIHARIKDEEAIHTLTRPSSTKHGIPSWLKVAAIVFICFGLSWSAYMWIANPGIEPPATMVNREVDKGQKLTMMLSDGSKVTLNAESRLSYPANFDPDKREVILEGEAFFEVARDENRPFSIVTKDIKTTVLGTSFNIKAYKDDSTVSVAVATGKVKVNRPSDIHHTYFLEPGKALFYQQKQNSFTVNAYDAQELMAWKEGVLVFKDATLQEVKQMLERWYGVHISIAGKPQDNWQYSGVFDQQSLENILLSISYVKHFSYDIDDKEITINF